MKNPMQPLKIDKNGHKRFKENKIVSYLLEKSSKGEKCDLNDLAVAAHTQDFSQDDQEQFAQLIGYSLSGFSELSYVSDATYKLAEDLGKSEKVDQLHKRINILEEKLSNIQEALKPGLAELYDKHPDDFTDRF